MRTYVSVIGALLSVLALGCGDLQIAGLDEPLRVEGATFHSGKPPESVIGEGPRVTTISLSLGTIPSGGQGVRVEGNVTEDAHAIALFLVGHGSGYWVMPVQGLDPAAPGERIFQGRLNFGEIPPGIQSLRIVALDEHGNSGGHQDRPFCVLNPVFDNGNACNPSNDPPELVVSLVFDNSADVDLILTGYDGTIVDAKHPVGGSGDRLDPTAPRLDRDSNTRCVPDGLNRENIYIRELPDDPDAWWEVYVDLFHACGFKSITYAVEIYRRAENEDGTKRLDLVERNVGFLRAEDAAGATGGRIYVTTLTPH